MNKIKRWAVLSVAVSTFLFASAAPSAAARSSRDLAKLQRVAELVSQGMEAYRQNDIEKAASLWREAQLIDPDNQRVQIFLNQIAPELEKAKVARQGRENAERQQKESVLKLDEKVALIETKEGTKLRDFLNTLSFVTGMNFFITHGADLPIVAKFEDKSLREILDAVTQPYSLSWSVKGNVVTLSPVWRTRTWRLDPDTLLSIQRLYEINQLQRLLWNGDTPPLSGIELRLDERQSLLALTDSPDNIEKMERLLGELRGKAPPALVTRVYQVHPDLADKMRVLIEAMLQTGSVPAYASERRVIIAKHEQGADMIIKDTMENLQKIEALLRDRAFTRQLEEETLEVYSANLTPRQVLTQNREQVDKFASDIREVVEVMLYSKEGKNTAMAQGRRLWYDPATLQLTVTDYPTNIKKVAEFIESLPQFEPKLRSKIIFLDSALASDVASQLQSIMGFAGVAGPEAGLGADTVSFTLRVPEERTWRDLSVRLIRVDAIGMGGVGGYGGGYGGYGGGYGGIYGGYGGIGGIGGYGGIGGIGGYGGFPGMGRFGLGTSGRGMGSVELVVRSATAQSSELNIQEFRSEVFEDYEIYVERISSSPIPGEGRATLRITYRPMYQY